MVWGEEIALRSQGFSDIRDITVMVQEVVQRSGISAGIAHLFVIGSTASITTIEHEPALVEDVREKLEELISSKARSRHSETWGDDNGFSHMRATLMGPGMTVPFAEGRLILGTWQQIVVVDHDNRPRDRRIYVQVMGE